MYVIFNIKIYVSIDRDNFYTGRVFGETASDVRVHLEDGVMTASIHLPEETYHIEVNIFYYISFHVKLFLYV